MPDPQLTIVITATYLNVDGARQLQVDGNVEGPVPENVDPTTLYRLCDVCAEQLGEILLPGASEELRMSSDEEPVRA